MTDQTTRIPLAEAERLAADVVELLRPACERIQVAGSIRRRKPDVKDIEIVAIPKMQPILDLLLHQVGETDALDLACHALVETGVLACRADSPAWGPKHKRMVYQCVNVDLFVVTPPAQWPVILAIRTGPGAFSKALVTRQRFGGLLPDRYKVSEGALRYRLSEMVVPNVDTEEELFRLLGLPWIEPSGRTWPLRGGP